MFKGLHLDTDPQNQPEGTYRGALNVSLSRSKGSVSQEESFLVADALPSGFAIIGHVILSNNDVVLFLSSRSNSGEGRIGLFSNDEYEDLVVDSIGDRLNFNLDYPVQAVAKVGSSGKENIYWVDCLNPVRYLEIPDSVISPVDTEQLELFPTVSESPQLLDVELQPGGILKTGSYHVAIAFEDLNGNRTNYLYVSNPISIPSSGQGDIDGAPNNSGSGYGISIDLSYVDQDYPYFRLALIKGTEVRLLPRKSTDFTSDIFISGSETFIPGAIDEVLVDRSYYNQPKAISQFGSSLYLGGLKEPERVSYQPWANAIAVHTTSTVVPVAQDTGSSVNGINIFKPVDGDYRYSGTQSSLKGFKRGEVYAFYISLVYKDGSESPAYHIPGRAPTGTDLSTNTFSTPTEAASIGATYKFQLEPQTDGVTGMGYWQNENEDYPNTDDFDIKNAAGDVTGTLKGEKVRHHHIPFDDNQNSQLFEGTDESNNANVVGIQLKNVRFPDEILDEIIAYKVYYAKRNIGNSKWFDQGFVERVTFNSSQNELGEITYHVANSSQGSTVFKYIAMSPFHSMRTKQNTNVLDGGYIRRITSSSTTVTGAGFTLAENRTPAAYDSLGLTLVPNAYPYTKLEWGGYIERNSISEVGTGGDKFYNTTGTELLIFQVSDYWDYNWDIVDIFKFRTNVYNSFYEQELVFTGYTNNILISSDSDGIWGGDVFVGYDASIVTIPTGNGTSVEDSESTIMLHQGVYESPDNMALRHQGEEDYEIYFPQGLLSEMQTNTALTGVISNAEEDFKFIRNYIGYNEEYSNQNVIKPSFPYNPFLLYNVDLSNRIVRSEKDNAESLEDGYRIFKENDFVDIPKFRGDIVKLVSLNSGLLIHCKSGFFRTLGREELEVEDFRAFVGQGNILAREPQELISIPEGFGGIQSPFHSINTKSGYCFVDIKSRKIYLLSNQIKEISANGLETFFDNNISESSNLRLGFDPNHDRIFVSHNVWQASYLPSTELWESFHSGTPEYYFWSDRSFYASNADDNLYVKNIDPTVEGSYFGNYEDMELTSIFNGNRDTNKLVHGILIDSFILNKSTNSEVNTKTIRTLKVFSQNQETDELIVSSFPNTTPAWNARRRNREWVINKIRANSTTPSHFPSWKNPRLTGKFIGITVTYRNNGYENIFIHKILPRYQETVV